MELRLPQERKDIVVSLSRVHTVHRGEKLTWDASKFIKTKIKDSVAFFEANNKYLKQLPMKLQDEIAECYKNLYDCFTQLGESILRGRDIQNNIKKLYELIPWKEFSQWCRNNRVVTIPPEVPLTFAHTTQHGATEEKTYDQEQYWELVVLGLYMRFALPAIGWALTENDVRAGTVLKEQRTFQIFNKSCIPKLPPVERLTVYIDANIHKEEIPIAAVLSGMGSSELPSFVLTRILIRKIALAEQDDNVITMAHNYIMQQVRALGKGSGFSGYVREKRLYTSGSEEDNLSVAENYKARQPISDGDMETLVYYSNQLEDMALRVDHTLDLDKLSMCLAAADKRPMTPTQPHQKVITQWVLSNSMPPRGIAFLNRSALVRTMAVTQSLLWHWGYVELALLMSAERSTEQGLGMTPSTRMNLSRDWHAKFALRYPYYREPTTKNGNVRHQNVAYMAIEGPNTNNPKNIGLASMILQAEWIALGPEKLIKEIEGVVENEFWVAPPNIRDQLASLICHIYDLRYGTPE